MNLHLAEIARHVAADAHAVVILDQAGWHGGNALIVPDNLTLLPLPPYSPELNPIENLWQFLSPQLPQRPRLRWLPSRPRRLLRRLEPRYAPFPARSAPSRHENGQKRSTSSAAGMSSRCLGGSVVLACRERPPRVRRSAALSEQPLAGLVRGGADGKDVPAAEPLVLTLGRLPHTEYQACFNQRQVERDRQFGRAVRQNVAGSVARLECRHGARAAGRTVAARA